MSGRDEMNQRIEDERRRIGRRRERGTVLLFVAISIAALIGVAALATDAGHVWAVRTELQGTVDAAALAAAANLIDPAGPTVTLNLARDEAVAYGNLNPADQVAISIDPDADVSFGNWDPDTESFDTSVDLTVPENVTAVRVQARMDGAQNPAVQTVLARVRGRNEFQVGADAIGYLGWAGSFDPGTVDLPVAIDCCAITGDPYCNDFCGYIQQNPYPNQATLSDGVTPATRLEFHSSPEQNACWTNFESDVNINVPGMEAIIVEGNSHSFGVQDPGIQLDNGTKTPVVDLLRDKMYGIGEFAGSEPAAQDLYPTPAGVDSWTTVLPVVRCQAEDHCAGSEPVRVIGAVCFEIREINVTPDKEILGQFFCPSQRPELDCGGLGSGSGGENFGIRATRPVLVQ